MSTFVIALILFAITYVLLFALPKYRATLIKNEFISEEGIYEKNTFY